MPSPTTQKNRRRQRGPKRRTDERRTPHISLKHFKVSLSDETCWVSGTVRSKRSPLRQIFPSRPAPLMMLMFIRCDTSYESEKVIDALLHQHYATWWLQYRLRPPRRWRVSCAFIKTTERFQEVQKLLRSSFWQRTTSEAKTGRFCSFVLKISVAFVSFTNLSRRQIIVK